jgi:Tfp pilus assembly protein PilN
MSLKKWLAFGGGVGIQISGPKGAESLHVCAVRVRPSGARVRGEFKVEEFAHQPAGEWGAGYAAFARKLGLKDAPVAVLLPRHDVITRTLALPGVADKDLDSAVRFQLDGLHPYSEEDVYFSWARLGKTASVLVAIARREAVDRYAALFAEAGIKLAAFTCSAAAIYSALRLFGGAPPAEMLAWDDASGALEVYGESAAKPVFSASLPDLRLAAAEMRIDPATEPKTLGEWMGASPALPFASALSSACPRLTLPLNLLPAERRVSNSALRWAIPTALGAVLLFLAGGFAALPSYERRHYAAQIESQIAEVSPRATRSNQLDKDAAAMRRRTEVLDDFRRQSKSDIDLLAELTKILPPPTWLNLTEISPKQVSLAGETDQAEPLLKVLNTSALLEASEFQGAPAKTAAGWVFRIRANRKGARP